MHKDEQLMVNLRDLFNKIAWLNQFKMAEVLSGYQPSEVHCIEAIGKNNDVNAIALAKTLYMTRGAISKLTKKLIEKELVERYKKADNKKEVYYRLTRQGWRVFNIHEKQHNEFHERDQEVFNQITEKEMDDMLHFVDEYRHHLDAEIKKQGLTIQ